MTEASEATITCAPLRRRRPLAPAPTPGLGNTGAERDTGTRVRLCDTSDTCGGHTQSDQRAGLAFGQSFYQRQSEKQIGPNYFQNQRRLVNIINAVTVNARWR